MRRNDVLRVLAGERERLAAYHVRSLSIFGSVARDEATEESDVDLLVEFDRTVGLLHFVRLRRFLTELLGTKVDLATPGSLGERVRDRIIAEAVRAA